jgi:hypothetical protein
MPRIAALLAAFAVAACAHRPPLPPVDLHVSGTGEGCRFEAEGQEMAAGSQAESKRLLTEAARRWKGRSVTVLGGPEAPFKCFGLAIYVLQRQLKDGRVGFIAEPPPEPD